MTKQMLYVDQDNNSLYDVTISDQERTINLSYAEQDEKWTTKVRGTMAATMYDHGNGVRIALLESEQEDIVIDLDYSQLAYVSMLIRALNLDTNWGGASSSVARYELKVSE